MQRRGVEVVVLEARQRPGGRVHTSGGDGLSQPVDLGASIITGTQTDEEKGLRPDPSAVLARSACFCLCDGAPVAWRWRCSDAMLVDLSRAPTLTNKLCHASANAFDLCSAVAQAAGAAAA